MALPPLRRGICRATPPADACLVGLAQVLTFSLKMPIIDLTM